MSHFAVIVFLLASHSVVFGGGAYFWYRFGTSLKATEVKVKAAVKGL